MRELKRQLRQEAEDENLEDEADHKRYRAEEQRLHSLLHNSHAEVKRLEMENKELEEQLEELQRLATQHKRELQEVSRLREKVCCSHTSDQGFPSRLECETSCFFCRSQSWRDPKM